MQHLSESNSHVIASPASFLQEMRVHGTGTRVTTPWALILEADLGDIFANGVTATHSLFPHIRQSLTKTLQAWDLVQNINYVLVGCWILINEEVAEQTGNICSHRGISFQVLTLWHQAHSTRKHSDLGSFLSVLQEPPKLKMANTLIPSTTEAEGSGIACNGHFIMNWFSPVVWKGAHLIHFIHS